MTIPRSANHSAFVMYVDQWYGFFSASFGKARWRILSTCLTSICDGNVRRKLPNRPFFCFMHISDTTSKLVKFSKNSYAKCRQCSKRWWVFHCPEKFDRNSDSTTYVHTHTHIHTPLLTNASLWRLLLFFLLLPNLRYSCRLCAQNSLWRLPVFRIPLWRPFVFCFFFCPRSPQGTEYQCTHTVLCKVYTEDLHCSPLLFPLLLDKLF